MSNKLQAMVVTNRDGQQFNVVFKWSVSRGRYTYGYHICRAFVNGEQVGKADGGGYDMRGVAISKWVAQQSESLYKDGDSLPYGFHFYEGQLSVDGTCGLDTILRGANLTSHWGC
jgi:hypothetical protein